MQTIAISDICVKLKSKDNIISFFGVLGNFIFIANTYRLNYTRLSCYDNKFFLKVIGNKKK